MRWTDIATVQIQKFILEQRSNINGSNKRAMDDGKIKKSVISVKEIWKYSRCFVDVV